LVAGLHRFDPFFCRQFFFRNRFLFAQAVFLPYPVSLAPYSQAAEQNSSPVGYQEEDLSGQVERLMDEVERLREEQASREQPRDAVLHSKPSFEDKAATTIVVFDGRRSEVQNFAVIGQTLWVFTVQRVRKIRISDLDVEATKEVKADRGSDFRAYQQPLTGPEPWVSRKKPTIFAFGITSSSARASTFP
jgi:hypothetical protein